MAPPPKGNHQAGLSRTGRPSSYSRRDSRWCASVLSSSPAALSSSVSSSDSGSSQSPSRHLQAKYFSHLEGQPHSPKNYLVSCEKIVDSWIPDPSWRTRVVALTCNAWLQKSLSSPYFMWTFFHKFSSIFHLQITQKPWQKWFEFKYLTSEMYDDILL
jgi:hypothetical protein